MFCPEPHVSNSVSRTAAIILFDTTLFVNTYNLETEIAMEYFFLFQLKFNQIQK